MVVVLAIIIGGLSIADVVVKDSVQSAVASRIESRSPGSHASVRISSFPFVGRLAVSGDVPKLVADVTNVDAGAITFSSVRLTITDLKVDRGQLYHGRVKPISIQRGRVVASIAQSSVDSAVHLPLVLRPGRVRTGPISVPARLTVSGDRIGFSAAGLPSLSIVIPVLDILPCVGSARIVTGAVRLSCRFRALPPLLFGADFSF